MSTNRRRTVMVIAIGFALGMIVARRLTIRVREDLLALFKDPINRAAADGTTPLLAALYHWDQPSKVFIPGKGAPAASGSSQTMHADLAMALTPM